MGSCDRDVCRGRRGGVGEWGPSKREGESGPSDREGERRPSEGGREGGPSERDGERGPSERVGGGHLRGGRVPSEREEAN